MEMEKIPKMRVFCEITIVKLVLIFLKKHISVGTSAATIYK